jgi:hypothetical protein
LTSVVLKTESSNVRIAMMQVDALRPHEKGSPLYLQILRCEILKDGMLRYPIIADERTGVILDGMHRWLALKSLGFTLIPTILVDALNNPGIRVGTRRIHRYTGDADGKVTIEKVVSAGLSGRLMEPRSTRHFFPFSKFQKVNYPLSLLKRDVPQNISRYLSTMDSKESSFAIEDWLSEISEELDFLARRKEEVEKEKQELLERVKSLKNGLPTL